MNIKLSNKLEDVMLFLTLMTKEELFDNKYTRFSVKHVQYYTAIKVDDVVVGLMNLSCRNKDKGYYSYSIGLLKNYREKGIAKATIQKIMEDESVKYLLGVVHSKNKESMNFHKNWLLANVEGKYNHFIKVRD